MTIYDAESYLGCIRQTEEAIERQRALLASATDGFLAMIAQRSLDTLIDMLSIQRRTYRMLTGTVGLTSPTWGHRERGAAEPAWSDELPGNGVAHGLGSPEVAIMGQETP